MANSPINTTVSVGFMLPIFVVLLILKLTNTVAWSWWIITLPLWVGPAILIAIVSVPFALFGIAAGVFKIGELLGLGVAGRRRIARNKMYAERIADQKTAVKNMQK